MAGSLNLVQIIGNLGADPDARMMTSGSEVCNLSIATSESWTDKQTGEKKDRVQWHKIVIFNEGIIKVAKNYLKKGSKAYIEGQLETRKWTDKEGKDQYATEIVLRPYQGKLILLDGRGSGDNSSNYRDEQYQNGQTYSQSNQPQSRVDEMADDIPF